MPQGETPIQDPMSFPQACPHLNPGGGGSVPVPFFSIGNENDLKEL